MAVHRQSHLKCVSAGRVTAQLLLSFLALSSPIAAFSDSNQQYPVPILPPLPSNADRQAPSRNEHIFSLRHIFHHGTYEYPNLHKRLDIKDSESTLWIESEDGTVERETRPLVARSAPMNIQRLKDRRSSVIEPMIAAARESGEAYTLSPEAWTLDAVSGPNITDKDTILTFAQMAANAYVDHPNTGDWKDVLGGFNRTDDYGFGWDGDGLRGYIYANEDYSIIVIGVKGTTLAVFDGDGTTTNDKENDNLFFSCCCGQQGNVLYRQVCDCATGTYTCNLTCLRKNLREENRYYTAARYLYSNVTALYPDSEVWLAGHSLGGSVSAMMGLTYGVPAITFESVPDALPASRLGLPAPPGSNPNTPQKRENSGIYHFGHTGDPIFLGICSGATASCSYAGYALESACHTGHECTYDIVGDYGYGVHITSHRIIWTIANVIKVYDKPPECKFTPECVDCPLWKSVEGDSSSTMSSSSTTEKTRTRTSTCKTPGWWGCLDETTTTSGQSTTTEPTATSTTSTCKTPGWFGCNDEITTTTKISTSLPTATKTTLTTCKSPGFFGGCNDPTTTSQSSASSTSTECETPGMFFGCYDESTTTSQSHTITSPPPVPSATASSATTTYTCTSSEWFGLICVDPSPTSTPTDSPHNRSHCARRSWFGFCKEWTDGKYDWKEDI